MPQAPVENFDQPIGSAPWLSAVRSAAMTYGPSSTQDLHTVQSSDWFAERAQSTRQAAEAFLRHEFDLLGCSAFVPHDPDREAKESGYRPIDWSLDPVRGLRFPMDVHHKEWNLYEMRPENADVKYPWELARCQHWNTLAQAYLITGETSYAQEIADQLDDFMEANPIGYGVNYTCTMDVGIRALNWVLAFDALRNCDALDEDWWGRAYQALYDHCVFIFENLENHYEVTSNHFLSNVVGLHYACQPFRGHEQGREWDAFCRKALEEEIIVQVLDDGADYESSIPYHRLVTELFMGSGWLAKSKGEPLSEQYYARLTDMMNYLTGIMRPDGLMPQVGDADDGRLHIFSRFGSWNPQSAMHMLAPAGVLLGREEWLRQAGYDGAWEALWWGMNGHAADGESLTAVCRLFPDAGHAVWRSGGDYLLVCNSIVGTKGFGNHKHNDQLSFEFHHGGRPLIVDPGSYVYTSDFDTRNRFRSSRYHNTVTVDDVEQNEMRPEWIFRMFESGTPEHLHFEDDGNTIRYAGKHVGYNRLDESVTHYREFKYLKYDNVLLVRDRFEGSGAHVLKWHFHCAPEVRPFSSNGSTVWLGHGSDNLYALVAPSGMPSRIQSEWYSPSYGARVRCSAVEFTQPVDLLDPVERVFAIAPAGVIEGNALQDVLEAFEKEPMAGLGHPG